MKAGRVGLAGLAVLSPLLFSSLIASQVPDRLLARDAARYLDLTPAQLSALSGVQASWIEYQNRAKLRSDGIDVEIAQETRRAKLDPVALGQRYAELETTCRQSQARRAESVTDARGLLTPAQLAKLAVLEQALAMMPVVQSAQAVNLLPAVLSGPPAGLPEGTLDVEFAYVRGPAAPLPGCRASPQVVRPGVDVKGSPKPVER